TEAQVGVVGQACRGVACIITRTRGDGVVATTTRFTVRRAQEPRRSFTQRKRHNKGRSARRSHRESRGMLQRGIQRAAPTQQPQHHSNAAAAVLSITQQHDYKNVEAVKTYLANAG
ncbi:unnamed protein product, partial [Ectocarpus sp. 12 AP-2014]